MSQSEADTFEYTLRRAIPADTPRLDYAKLLNPDQLAAVQAPPGAILVIAGAGSGKTRTLTHRVAYLVENGVEPENILLLTFTNKAAKEMLERVSAVLPHDISRMWGGTFHHIGNRLLRRHAPILGWGNDFTILDRDDAKDFLSNTMVECGWDAKANKDLPKADVLLEVLSLTINKAKSIEDVLEEQFPYFMEYADRMSSIAVRYQERKRAGNVMDYDDLLALSLRVLQTDEGVRQRYQQQFQHVLVDEYQDTNRIQAEFIDTLAGFHKQVMVVGDDAQSIYSWRGADFKNILTFPDRYEGAQVVKIEVNYRSTPEILALANRAISGNINQFKKDLKAVRPPGKHPKPALVTLPDSTQQALFIAQRIEELQEEGVDPREIAVLYRAHFHAMELQMELTRRDIPFQITSGLRFFEQAHIKDISSFLRLSINPRDELSFKRIAAMLPGVGSRTADKLWSEFAIGKPLASLKAPAKAAKEWAQWAETQRQIDELPAKSPSERLRIALEGVYEDYMRVKFPNFESRLEDVNQLQVFAEQFSNTEDFLSELTLLTNVDGSADEKKQNRTVPSIRLSTVHQAKGLEWRYVFVIMLCDGLFPSSRSTETPEGEEEERRLFYVAVTRARDELYLSYPELRRMNGSQEFWQKPSRFLDEIPRDLVNRWRIKNSV